MKLKTILTCTAAGAVIAACTLGVACKGNGSGDAVSITFWGANSQYNTAQYRTLVDNYNEGQGKIDNVYVKYSPKGSDYSSNLSGTLSGRLAPNVCMIGDKYYKMYAAAGLLANLENFIDDKSTYTEDRDGNVNFDLGDIYDVNVYRYRYDKENNTAGGDDSPLYALPNGSNPTMMYYNTDYFKAAGVNIISVAEEELDSYNLKNGTSFMPHGYAEYTVGASPAQGLESSLNLQGENVVKVFNDRIAMNWTELITLSRIFTYEYNPSVTSYGANLRYGFLSEWWFPYGWSVGGDCIQWSESKGQYVFTLGDGNPNYMATDDVTVNGAHYSAGEILGYNDALTVTSADGSLYELPSQLDAFTEFCRLYQKTDGAGEMKGYGIAPDPTTVGSSRTTFFTSGKCAIVMEQYSMLNTINENMKYGWNYAPAWQYREYEGGDSLGQFDGKNGEMKVIGASYDGEVYTGRLKTVNGTQIVGEKSCSALNTGYAISEKSADREKAAAWKFIQYAVGKQGQSILATANDMIPNGISYCNSDEYLKNSSIIDKNIAAAVDASSYNTVMDECYLEDQVWVDYWADILNTDVRGGTMTLTQFFNTVTDRVNSDLTGYTVRLLRR